MKKQLIDLEIDGPSKYKKEIRTKSYTVLIGEEEHWIDKTIENSLYELGFIQSGTVQEKEVEPIEGCCIIETKFYNGIFYKDNYFCVVLPYIDIPPQISMMDNNYNKIISNCNIDEGIPKIKKYLEDLNN